MTDLRRTVTRRTTAAESHRGRRYVVRLEPGDVIAIREAGCRTWFAAPIGRVATAIVRWHVDAARSQRRTRQ